MIRGDIFGQTCSLETDWQVSQINIYANKKTKAAATDASTAARAAKIELQSNAISVQMENATRQTDILPARLSQQDRKTHSFPAVCEAAGQPCSQSMPVPPGVSAHGVLGAQFPSCGSTHGAASPARVCRNRSAPSHYCPNSGTVLAHLCFSKLNPLNWTS